MSAVRKFRGMDFMPLKLKGVLIKHGITQASLGAAVLQSNGVALSHASMSFIINGGYFPKSTPQADIVRQTETFLRDRGVPKAEIASIWEPDDGELQTGHALGSHLSASTKAAEKRVARQAAEEAIRRETTIEPVEPTMLSPNAKRHFKLFRDPFQDDVNGTEDVFLSAEQRYVAEAMFQIAKHGGILAAVGESGSGKTTLRKLLLERIKGQPIRVIFPRALDKTRLSTGNICQAIINDLAPGTKFRSSLEGQARQVEDVLLQSSRADNTHVLVIEEAHDLSIATLKYLKRFFELEDGFKKLLSIVLIGQPELKDKLDESKHPEAREFIRRCEMAELLPLGSELEKYIQHKFARLKMDPASLLAVDAYDGIRARLTKQKGGQTFSQLYPLVVNNLLTKAMNKAAEIGVPVVTGDLVRAL